MKQADFSFIKIFDYLYTPFSSHAAMPCKLREEKKRKRKTIIPSLENRWNNNYLKFLLQNHACKNYHNKKENTNSTFQNYLFDKKAFFVYMNH